MKFRPSALDNPGIRMGAGPPTGQYYVTIAGERGMSPDGWHWGYLAGRIPELVKIKGPLVPGQRIQFKRMHGNTTTQWAILRDRRVMPQHSAGLPGATGMPGPGMVGFDAYSMHPGVRVAVPPAVPNPRWKNVSLKSSAVVLTDAMYKFLDAIDPKLSFPIVITSGLRTPASQAYLMMRKLAAEGKNAVYGLYAQDDLVAEVVGAGSTSSAASVLEDQVDRGRFISRHMRGDALDIRSRDLTSAQQAAVMGFAQELGGKVVDERSTSSPHIHVEKLDRFALVKTVARAAASGVKVAATNMVLVWGVSIVSGVVVLGTLLLVKRAKSRRMR